MKAIDLLRARARERASRNEVLRRKRQARVNRVERHYNTGKW